MLISGRGEKTYNLSGTLDSLTLLDETVGTEKHDTDLAGFEVHAHTLDAGGEPDDLSIDWNINKAYKKTGPPTRPAPQPGRWSCHGHERYRHCF